MATILQFPSPSQGPGPQPAAAKRKRPNKRVPSCLTGQRQNEALSCVRAGRSIYQTAKEFSVGECVITELFLRSLERRLRRVEQVAA